MVKVDVRYLILKDIQVEHENQNQSGGPAATVSDILDISARERELSRTLEKQK